MEKKLWELLANILFITNGLCVLILIEVILYKFPFVTLFLVILYLAFHVNCKNQDKQ